MSPKIYKALNNLKKFNYEHIYNTSISKEDKNKYKKGINTIFKKYLKDLETNNKESIIYNFIKGQDKTYIEKTPPKRIVIDFIAGMTDDLFLSEIQK